MADNITLNAGTGGKILRTLQDSNTVDWPVSVVCYATSLGTPDALTVPLAAALADATANPTALLVGACLEGFNGTTWDRLKSTTANGLVVDVSRVQGTTAVSAVSLPLPAGASTAAKQAALGTAGTASADVLTVQGIASMVALKVDASATTQPISGTVSITANSSVNVAQLAGTTTDTNSGVKSAGTLRVVLATDQPALTNALKVDGSAVTQPVSGTFWQATQPVSGTVTANAGTGTFTVQQSNVTADYDTGAGTQTTTMFGLALPASGGAVAGGTATNPLRTDPTGVTTQPVSGTFWQATQPVSGTFWQATQPVSGTVTANLGTLNGVALDTSVNGLLVSQGSTTSGEKGPIVQGAVTTSAPTYTTAQTSPLSLDTSGNLRVLATQAGSVAVTGTFWQATQPVSGTFWQATQPVSGTVTASQATAASLNATVVGTGTFATQAAQSGTWNVGTVTTVSAVTAITNALPAGTNLIGQVASSHETGTVYSGTTALTPKFAVITASSSGATTIVAAVTSKKIRVLRWSLSSNGAVNVKWQSHVTPTDISGLHYLTQFASAGGAYCPVGIFQTVAGEALDINLSTAVAVGGELTYVEV